MVALAYGGDLARAADDTDEQVASTVAEYERRNQLPVRDYRSIGQHDEGRELDDE